MMDSQLRDRVGSTASTTVVSAPADVAAVRADARAEFSAAAENLLPRF
jgi:hypothetical protein